MKDASLSCLLSVHVFVFRLFTLALTRATGVQLKSAMGEMNVDAVEDLQDDMTDLMDQTFALFFQLSVLIRPRLFSSSVCHQK